VIYATYKYCEILRTDTLEHKGYSHWKVKMKISELSQLTQVAAKTIRYYEQVGLLPPPARSINGYRIYRQRDVDALVFIRRSRALNMSLDDIRQLLQVQQNPHHSCQVVDQLLHEQLTKVKEKQRELASLEASLAKLVNSCQSDLVENCSILQTLNERPFPGEES